MKHLLLGILSLVLFSTTTFAQKPQKKVPESVFAKDSVLTTKWYHVGDTIPARIVIENPDNFMEVIEGFVVRGFWVKEGEPKIVPENTSPTSIDYYNKQGRILDPYTVFPALTRPLKPKK